MGKKVITFRMFKKTCCNECDGWCQETEWHKKDSERKCCEKNCPVFKKLKDHEKAKDDSFNKAISLALTIVFGVYDEPTMAYEILKDVGISVGDLIKYCERVGAEYDLKFLQKLKEQENGR